MVPPYSTTKAALDAFTLGLAQDLGPLNITANVIAPVPVETDINLQLLSRPEIRKGIEDRPRLDASATWRTLRTWYASLPRPKPVDHSSVHRSRGRISFVGMLVGVPRFNTV